MIFQQDAKLQYRWKSYGPRGIDANAAGEALTEIGAACGGDVTAPLVVEAARPESSVLHPAFEWDDDAAAERWRLWQARHMLNHLIVTVVKADGEIAAGPAFVSIKRLPLTDDPDDEGERVYTPTLVARTQPEAWSQVLQQARDDIRAVQRRIAGFDELDAASRALETARMAIEDRIRDRETVSV